MLEWYQFGSTGFLFWLRLDFISIEVTLHVWVLLLNKLKE